MILSTKWLANDLRSSSMASKGPCMRGRAAAAVDQKTQFCFANQWATRSVMHQSTGSFALNPKLPVSASSSSSSSADSSTYLAWESERRNWKKKFTEGFQMIMSPEAAASALVSPFTELDWVSLEIWAAICWALAGSRDPTTTERPALAYWKARRLPISPVPGITAIVRRVKSGAAITPPKTYNYQNPNQPETKTQPTKIQTMIKWKKRTSSTDVGLLKLVLQNVMLNTVKHKTGFYHSDWRSNDRSSFRRFTLPAGTIFRPPSALPEAV